MADLYVLEGRGSKRHLKTNHPIRPRHYQAAPRKYGVPGIAYGDPIQALQGWGFNPISAVRSVSHVVANTARAAQTVVARPVAHAVAQSARVVQTDVLRPAAHGMMTAERATVKAVGYAADVTRRVAKRIVKGIAKKVLFKGDFLLGSAVAAVPKNAAKGILIPLATTAVIANTVTAPAAPAVPVIVNEVIDELYNAISDAVAKGLSPSDAAKSAQANLDKLEPGEENDPKVGLSSYMPVFIGAAAFVALIAILKNRG